MPDWRDIVMTRLRAATPHETLETETIEELAQHLRDRYDELRAVGIAHEEAVETTLQEWADDEWRAAPVRQPPRRRRSGVVHDMSSSGSVFTDLLRDLRHGLRLLPQNPGYSATVVLTLAFGIAATTVAFTVINTLLLSPLPVADPDRVVKLATHDKTDARATTQRPLSYPNLLDLQNANEALSSLAGYAGPFGVTLTDRTPPQRVFAELVTANYFETLGAAPLMGRFFLPEEDRVPGAHAVLVLGYAAWQGRFAGDGDIVGRTIIVNRTPYTVIGVAPAGFKGLDPVFGPDVWIPSSMTADVAPADNRNWLSDRAAIGFHAVGRLRPNVSMPQAQANVSSIAAQLARDYPLVNRDLNVSLTPLSRSALMGFTPPLAVLGSLALLAVPGLVLLIACSNVASVALARSTTRGHEFAVRLALGAGRSRVVRQLLTENAVLGAISGAVGLGGAWVGARLLWSFRPDEYAQNLVDLSLDGRVVLFATVVSALTTMCFALAPALTAGRANLVAALNADSRTAGRTRRTIYLQKALLVGQVAFSLVALATAGVFLQHLQRAYAIEPGFERRQLGVVMLNPGQAGYDRDQAEALYRLIRDRVAALPGVTAASWASNLPLFNGPSRKISTAGRTQLAADEGVHTVVNSVDVDYFNTTGIALVGGRAFTEHDRRQTLPVAIINETLAQRYWPGGNPIGEQISFVGDAVPRQIVGVARTVNYDEVGELPQPCVYVPLTQNFTDAVVLYVRTAVDPAPVLITLQGEIRRIDPALDVADARTIETVLSQALFGQTMGGALLGVFGLLALALASLGMYGVMAYSVHLRTREMGVRLALGAEPHAVVRLVLRQALTLVGIGTALGLIGAIVASALLSSSVHGINRVEPVSLLGAAAVLTVVAFTACLVPARAASRLDPSRVLRAE